MLAVGFAESERLYVSPRESVYLDLPAIAESTKILDACLAAVLAELEGLKRTAAREIRQAVERAFMDAIRIAAASPHAHINITLALTPEMPDLRVEFRGIWSAIFDLPGARGRDCENPPEYPSHPSTGSGAERFLIRSLVDQARYHPKPGDNRWCLRKQLPDPAPGDTRSAYGIHLNIPAMHQYLSVPRRCIAAILSQMAGLAETDAFVYDLQLATYEAGANIANQTCAGRSIRVDVMLTYDPQTQQFEVKTRDTSLYPFDFAALSNPTAPARSGERFRGPAWLFASAVPTGAAFYLLNLLLSRWLGPVAFADFSLIMALMLVISLVATGLQQTAAKFAAIYTSRRDWKRLVGLRSWLERFEWLIGSVILFLLVLSAPLSARLFGMPLWPFVLLGVGIPFYISRSVDRGLLQGQAWLQELALSYHLEAWGQWLFVLLLVALGGAVNGAVFGIALSFVVAWWVAWRAGPRIHRSGDLGAGERRTVLIFALPVMVATVGQILLNTGDILLVRRFFPPEQAGQYAAMAILGHGVFLFTWLVSASFLFKVTHKQPSRLLFRHRLLVSLALVLAISMVAFSLAQSIPTLIVSGLLDRAYLDIAPLLGPYIGVMTLYALSNVLLSYGLTVGYNGGAFFSLAAGLAQLVGITLFHSSLRQVIYVQLLVMAALFVGLFIWLLSLKLLSAVRQTAWAS